MIKSKCVDRDRQTKSLVSHKLQTHMEQNRSRSRSPKWWEVVMEELLLLMLLLLAAQALFMSFSAYCVCTSAQALTRTLARLTPEWADAPVNFVP